MTGGETDSDHTNPVLIEQRIRNRIIEYLELASSFEAQLAYESRTIAFVPAEVINQWEDWVHSDPRLQDDHSAVCTPQEIEALGSFHAAWGQGARRMPEPLPTLGECQALEPWQKLRNAASAALAVFTQRGTFPDDEQ